jgi:hypothetical protein
MHPLLAVAERLILLAVGCGGQRGSPVLRSLASGRSNCCGSFGCMCNGIPSHDHLCDLLARLDARVFQLYFVDWVAA